MRVGVYVDGYNLYYGGRALVGGRGVAGWRWLDLRALAAALVASRSGWPAAESLRVVYCTARIRADASNPTAAGPREQEVYLRALHTSGSVDVVELGNYVSRVATAPLATATKKGKPALAHAGWPVQVRDATCTTDVPEATFMVSVARREEKGSDVNVASHMLIDVLRNSVDAVVVISNDSDLSFPIAQVRDRAPVGLVNPTKAQTAGALRGSPSSGVGGHWWYQLQAADLFAAQLPPTLGQLSKPAPW